MAELTIRLALVSGERSTTREDFWNAIRRGEVALGKNAARGERGNALEQPDAELERRLLDAFGESLAEHVRRHLLSGGIHDDPIWWSRNLEPTQVFGFGFRTRSIGYGSIHIRLDPFGLEHLAGIFGSLDAFVYVIEMYSPLAFAEVLEIHPQLVRADVTIDEKTAEGFNRGLKPKNGAAPVSSENLGAELGTAAPKPASSPRRDAALERFDRAWRAVNMSFVVPVLFMVAIWYLAMQSLSNERAIVAGARTEVQARESALLEGIMKRDGTLLDLLLVQRALDSKCVKPEVVRSNDETSE